MQCYSCYANVEFLGDFPVMDDEDSILGHLKYYHCSNTKCGAFWEENDAEEVQRVDSTVAKTRVAFGVKHHQNSRAASSRADL